MAFKKEVRNNHSENQNLLSELQQIFNKPESANRPCLPDCTSEIMINIESYTNTIHFLNTSGVVSCIFGNAQHCTTREGN